MNVNKSDFYKGVNMVSDSNTQINTKQSNHIFKNPQTLPSERLDELVSYNPDKHGDAEQIKQILSKHWKPEFPQPYISLDGKGNFILVWMAIDPPICITLHINIEDSIGTYRTPYLLLMPLENNGWYLQKDHTTAKFDLNTKEAWLFLESDLSRNKVTLNN